MRILIADDHALLRCGLIQILAEAFPGAEFGEAGTTQQTLECLGKGPWDVLVLDLFMPGRGGTEVLTEVRQQQPHLPVLVLSSAPEEQAALRVLKLGAAGYLTKQTATTELPAAVRKVASGGRYTSPGLAERLVVALGRAATEAPHEQLSDREFLVMQLTVAGKSIQQIARELVLSPKTVSTFHTRIWEKLGVRNDVELVYYALEHGLIPPDSGHGLPASDSAPV